MAYGDFKYLTRRTASDKILHDKEFNISKNPKYDGYQRGCQWFINFLIKKLLLHVQINLLIVVLKMKICQTSNFQKNYITQILKIQEKKSALIFIGNISGSDIQLINKFHKGIHFLLCVVDIYRKYAWVIHLKDNGITIANAFQKLLKESNRKPKKI